MEEKTQGKEKIEKAQQEVEKKVEAPVEQTQEPAPTNISEINEVNWKKFREDRKREREEKLAIEKIAREKEAEAAALKAAMDALLNKPAPQYEEPDDTEEQRIAKLVHAKFQEQEQKRELERKKKDAEELPKKLTAAFSDFNVVCTEENLDYLKYHYPEVERALSYAPDGFEKWSDVYKAVKRFVPNTDTKKDQAKIEKNMAKPKAISAGLPNTGDSAPVYLDDAKRAANWERMQRTMKGV